MMISTFNTSNDSNHGSTTSKKDDKKQQFTKKQRMDMYAFCVLELETNGNQVSIKKQQQAIHKALKKGNGPNQTGNNNDKSRLTATNDVGEQPKVVHHGRQQSDNNIHSNHSIGTNSQSTALTEIGIQQDIQTNGLIIQAPSTNGYTLMQQESTSQYSSDVTASTSNAKPAINGVFDGKDGNDDGKTLLQLRQEISVRCYSDHQRTQVLTSKMLKEVQRRYAKYYPDSHCPSRTTIKHVFAKCIEHGSVDNVKNPRKAVKIPHGDEVEYLLTHQPQMSLRQMARELNVSTGTVSRRCKALGLVPESVTIKHQQMATARRQKQIKEQATKTKSGAKRQTPTSRNRQTAAADGSGQEHYANGLT